MSVSGLAGLMGLLPLTGPRARANRANQSGRQAIRMRTVTARHELPETWKVFLVFVFLCGSCSTRFCMISGAPSLPRTPGLTRTLPGICRPPQAYATLSLSVAAAGACLYVLATSVTAENSFFPCAVVSQEKQRKGIVERVGWWAGGGKGSKMACVLCSQFPWELRIILYRGRAKLLVYPRWWLDSFFFWRVANAVQVLSQ